MDITQEHLLKAMPNRGLQTSSWAHNSTRASNTSSLGTSQWSQPRPGDWTCKLCDFSNFQWRDACLRCSASKAPSDMGSEPYICERIHPNLGVPCGTKFTLLYDLQRHEDLIHKVRQNADGGAIYRGKENERPIDKHTVPALDEAPNTTLPDSHGLLTSRWAPRNYAGRPKRAGGDQVWIKTVPAPISTSNLSQGHTHSIAETPYLDLPYEVQHCILTIIQRILEEGCYDFASRWIPNVLYENKWTCSEAVELSTWRKTLPTSLPYNAITQVNNYTLERALADAVRVRNSAAHRHLESNHELRRMSLHSRDLMTMFSDVSRHEKFVRLWLELNEWETGSRNNEQAARDRLQRALQEIGERPMDDMDWTPNSVSLQEVTEEPLIHEGLGHQALYVDEMEID